MKADGRRAVARGEGWVPFGPILLHRPWRNGSPAPILALLLALSGSAWGQMGAGGVILDAEGMLRVVSRPPGRGDLAGKSEKWGSQADARLVSLRRLGEELEVGTPGPEHQHLAGLVEIAGIRLDAGGRDILLEGRAEPIAYTQGGTLARGEQSGRAAVHLENLITVLRTVRSGRVRIRCSIDPTRSGLAAIAEYWSEEQNRPRPASAARGQRAELAKRLGPQLVSIDGVPAHSRLAHTLIEADYLMKRMALGAVSVPRLPNHADTVAANIEGQQANWIARWWFTTAYDGVEMTDEGLVRLRGPGIRLLNEAVLFDETGTRRGTGRPVANDRFSEEFTRRLDELEQKYPPLAELRHAYELVMLLSVAEKAGAITWLDGSVLLDEVRFPLPEHPIARQAEPVVTLSSRRSGGKARPILCYGGVSIDAADLGPIPLDAIRVGGSDGGKEAGQPGRNRNVLPDGVDFSHPQAPEEGDSVIWWQDAPKKLRTKD